MNLKRIPMDGLKNFRDIGGYVNKAGKQISWNQLYRCEGLSFLSEEDQKRLTELNIKTIIDLRSTEEQTTSPDIIIKGASYFSCPLIREHNSIGREGAHVGAFRKSLVTGYITMVEEAPDLIAKAFELVVEGLEKGAVVFHCTAGKDRTGVLAAVLLMLLDAYEEDVIADYQVTHTYNEKGVNIFARKILEQRPEAADALNEDMLSSHPKTISEVVERLNEWGPAKWLEENGVSKETIQSYRMAMLK